jgi:DNA-binding SARP family transcriptional activator/WD40 repeat protein
MRIAVLGPLEVRRDTGEPVAVPGAKERLLLAVLAADSPGVVSTDHIVETLWNGDRPASARSSLQVHLVHLRSALEPERPRGSTGRYILRRGAGYSLAADREDVDALRFTDLAARGRALLVAGDAAAAVRSLSAALVLWRGEPYGDWPDADFADTERRRLSEVRTGAVTALLEARLALGEDAEVVPELEQRLAGDPLQEEWWRLLVLALYRCGRQGDALAAAQRARRLLAEELGTDPGPRLRAVEAAVLAQDPSLELRPAVAATTDSLPSAVATCPYKGLATYEAADAALFRGRGRLVTHLVARLVDSPLLVVSGPSGAGKSSVVRAGLVPALGRDALPGSAGWRPVVLSPGRRPVDWLAEFTGEAPAEGPVLLVCDQFEELWAPGGDLAERTAFLDTVLGLLADGIAVRCVVVVRGDHVGLLAEHTALAERVGSGVVLAPSLTDDELREVVVEPAAAVGLDVETDLVDAVVADVRGRPGALPLLSMALVGTWERRRGDRLTLSGYLEAGGVTGALTRSAEAAYGALDDQGKEVARRLLVRLADSDDAGALVRRPTPLAELDLDGNGGDVRRSVIESFVTRRLLTVDGERLDVAHEALLTAWPRLARWLDDDAAGRAVRRHLTPAAQDWQRRGEPEEDLYRGPRLAAALDWAAADGTELTGAERRFLDASRSLADAELLAAREQTRREATGRRRTRRLAAGLAAVLVVALVTALLAVRSQRAAGRATTAAEDASLDADGNRLAALSTTVDALDLSFLLAAQAFRLADTPETQDGLLAVLAGHRRVVRAAPVATAFLRQKLGNGGRTIHTVGIIGQPIRRWPVADGGQPHTLLTPGEDWSGWRAVTASPSEDVLAAAGGTPEQGPWIRLVDAEGAVHEVPDADSLGGEPFGLSFTSDGRQLRVFVAESADGAGRASWRLITMDTSDGSNRDTGIAGSVLATPEDLDVEMSADSSTAVVFPWPDAVPITLIDITGGRQTTVTPPVRDAAISARLALASGAALLWDDGAVTLFDRAGAVVQQFAAHDVPVHDLVLSPDRTWGATVADGGEVQLWRVDPATGRWSRRESLEGHASAVLDADIDPAGSRLFTIAQDGTGLVWDLRPDGGFGEANGSIPGRWVSNRLDVIEPGRLVVAPTRPLPSGAEDLPYGGPETLGVAATFLDPRTGDVLVEVPVGDTLEEAMFGASVAVSEDGRLVAVTSGWATTILDTGTREQVERIVLPAGGSTGADGEPLPAGPVWSAAWTADDTRLLLGTEERVDGEAGAGALAVVDTATWDTVDRVRMDVVAEVMEVSPDGGSVAVASANSSELVILDAGTLAVRHTIPVDDRLWDLSFSSDGQAIVAIGGRGALHVIDPVGGTAREPVPVHDGPALDVEWLKDDRTVVSVGHDGRVLLYDTERELLRSGPLPASTGTEPGNARLVPDPAEEMVLLNDQWTGLRYPLDPAVWLREACAVAGRDLTRHEWDRFLPGRPWEPTCSDLG